MTLRYSGFGTMAFGGVIGCAVTPLGNFSTTAAAISSAVNEAGGNQAENGHLFSSMKGTKISPSTASAAPTKAKLGLVRSIQVLEWRATAVTPKPSKNEARASPQLFSTSFSTKTKKHVKTTLPQITYGLNSSHVFGNGPSDMVAPAPENDSLVGWH